MTDRTVVPAGGLYDGTERATNLHVEPEIFVEVGDDDVIIGFKEGGRIPYWVSCGVYVFSQEAIDRLPDIGDHETTTFPELVAERRLYAYRHEGLWLTVNTPKELRTAAEHITEHPEWLAA